MGNVTERGLQVMKGMAAGKNTKTIASELKGLDGRPLSPKTVEFHRKKAQESLGLGCPAELIVHGVKSGLTAEPKGLSGVVVGSVDEMLVTTLRMMKGLAEGTVDPVLFSGYCRGVTTVLEIARFQMDARWPELRRVLEKGVERGERGGA